MHCDNIDHRSKTRQIEVLAQENNKLESQLTLLRRQLEEAQSQLATLRTAAETLVEGDSVDWELNIGYLRAALATTKPPDAGEKGDGTR